ncbi:ankyrin repeat-containing domain protein [Colletotrichum cereale]|nr:ankyrin repeat-containing domain protein [Colletotrichum cereale]
MNVESLLRKGKKIESKTSLGILLGIAVKADNEPLVQLLLDQHADVEARDVLRSTPLVLAVARGYESIARLLLAHGADKDVRDKYDGMKPIETAAYMGHEGLFRLLSDEATRQTSSEKGKEIVDDQNIRVMRPLLITAAMGGNEAIVRNLLQQGADIEATIAEDIGVEPSMKGTKALIMASAFGSQAAVRVLLEHGADPNAQSGDGTTALIAAAREDSPEIIDMLLQRGANMEAADNIGSTALIAAAEQESPEIIDILLQRGANMEAADNSGSTALIAAAKEDYPETIDLLLQSSPNSCR